MEEVLAEIASYPDVSRPIKIYRYKAKWRVVVNGRFGMYCQEEAEDLQECAEKVLKDLKDHYKDRKPQLSL